VHFHENRITSPDPAASPLTGQPFAAGAIFADFVDGICENYEKLTDATALAYARLRAALRRSGRPIPANDAWIAALALQHRLPVLSRDEHFDVVAGLERKGW
jgi:predicted nucleic acid-binding protein